MVFLTLPHWSRTIRQPGPEMTPFCVGSEPTITQPLRSATRAVVRPTPPGQLLSLMPANSETLPCGLTSTIVVPVPCTFALLLKLLTSTSPRYRRPVLCGTTATPYGLTSPLAGTVDAMTLVWFSGPMKVSEAFAAVATMPLPASRPAVAMTIAAMPANLRVGLMSLLLPPLSRFLRIKYGRGAEWDWRNTDEILSWWRKPFQL